MFFNRRIINFFACAFARRLKMRAAFRLAEAGLMLLPDIFPQALIERLLVLQDIFKTALAEFMDIRIRIFPLG